jgi:hypothetical protein
MKNRAKCKLCNSTIESFHGTDYVVCQCGEIALDGGLGMRCYANDLKNIIRIDDEGNEIIPTIIEGKSDTSSEGHQKRFKKETVLFEIREMIKSIENLPDHAMTLPVSQYELCHVLVLMSLMVESD